MAGAWARLPPVAISLFLIACRSGVHPPLVTEPELQPLPAPDLSGAPVYVVDTPASEAHVQVLRGGTMAALGHNHVVSSRSLTGRIWLHPDLARSGLELSFPVSELIVDDPAARLAAGSTFSAAIPQSSRDGTRRNMLRAEVLDGERYPTIAVRSVRVEGLLPSLSLLVRITIKDRSRDAVVPVAVLVGGEHLTATGEFDVLQTQFGIQPYSVAMGALAVQDRLHVTFRIVANR